MDVGEDFAGYRIESLVGRGGMGVVYRATQLDLGRTVALKVIAPEALEDEAARARFVSEARHAASIDDPNIVPIFAAGEADGKAYFAMRFVEGDDLRTRVRRDGPLTPPAAAALLQSAAAALDAIHAAGLVHRDVKPANILLGTGDHVYLTDFGLARQILARGGTATGAGRWAGSLHYAAPEQIRGGRVDARADIYALGGVLVFMLTGKVPYDRETDEAVLWAHVGEPPPRPSELGRGVPKAFDEVVLRAMAKLPSDRYPSAGDLGRAALAAAEGRRAPQPAGTVARGAASPSGAFAIAGLSDEAPTLTAAQFRTPLPDTTPRWRTALYVAGGIAAVALFVAGVVAMAKRGNHAGGAALQAAAPPAATATASPTPPPSPGPSPSPSPAPTRAFGGPHVAATFARVTDRPNSVARVGRELWVTSYRTPWITRLDAMTGTNRALGPYIGFGGADLAVHGQLVWVASGRARQVLEIDAESRRVLARLPQPGYPFALAADEDGSVWAGTHPLTPGGTSVVTHYDASGHFLRRFTVPAGVTAMVLGAGALWVAEARARWLLRIDRLSGTMRPAARLIGPAWALAWGDSRVWASVSNDDLVASVDPFSARVSYADGGHRPEQLAVVDHRVFVASRGDQTLRIIDPVRMKTVGRLPMQVNPFSVTADAGHVWVTALGADAVTRVDVS